VPLGPTVEELLELVAPQFNAKGLYLRLNLEPHAPTQIYTDRDKLRQILKNFLANAAKFTESGGVTVSVGRDEGTRPVKLCVEDTGIGIPQDKQEIIFEAFQQADGSTRRRYGGTGLGLSISRELAKLLDGTIEVESREGQGSRFTLFLPVEIDASGLDAKRIVQEQASRDREATEPEAPPVPDRTFADRWVLLVEREVTGLVAETRLLESFGLRVQSAADADEAIETLREEPGCSLVLLAELMSVPNTCDTIRAIRGDAQVGGIPLVVIGSAEEPDLSARFLNAGADGFVSKPVVSTRLEAVLTAMLGSGAEQGKQKTA
jgi:CheY-like chemotaxis protein